MSLRDCRKVVPRVPKVDDEAEGERPQKNGQTTRSAYGPSRRHSKATTFNIHGMTRDRRISMGAGMGPTRETSFSSGVVTYTNKASVTCFLRTSGDRNDRKSEAMNCTSGSVYKAIRRGTIIYGGVICHVQDDGALRRSTAGYVCLRPTSGSVRVDVLMVPCLTQVRSAFTTSYED